MKMNEDIPDNMNIYSPTTSENNNKKYISIQDFNYNKMPLINSYRKTNDKSSFFFLYNSKLNNKIIIHKNSSKFLTGPEYVHNFCQNNNYIKLSKIKIASNNNKISNNNNNLAYNNNDHNFFKKNINILKSFNYKNLISRNDNNLSTKEISTNKDPRIYSDISGIRYDRVLKQRNYKNLNGCLLVNDLKRTECDRKNILKNKSELSKMLEKKLVLPKMKLKQFTHVPQLIKKETPTNTISNEKENKINTIIKQKDINKNNKLEIPKIIYNNRKNILKKLNIKKSRSIKNSLTISIESLSIPGTNLNTNKINQDTYFIIPDTKSINILENQEFIQIFGIFDGHGDNGHIISKEVNEYFKEYFNKKNLKDSSNIYENLCKNNYKEIFNLFNEINLKLHKKYSNENDNINIINNSGTTASIIILFRNKVLSINLGHSKSILIYEDDKIIQLNKCHIPELEEEKKRIEENGGEVKREGWSEEGPKRICYKETETKKYSGLAVSRSFGDFSSEQLGVISVPEIKEYDIDFKEIKIMIIATDGIWEFLNNEKVRDIILPYYEENNIIGGINKLINVGSKTWSVKNPYYIDDLTAILLFFNNQY